MALALCHTDSISACESVRRVAAGVDPTREPNNSVCGLGCSSQAEGSALKALPASLHAPLATRRCPLRLHAMDLCDMEWSAG